MRVRVESHVRQVRLMLRLSLRTVAQASKLSTSKIWRIEHAVRQPSLEEIAQLAEGMQVHPMKLFTFRLCVTEEMTIRNND